MGNALLDRSRPVRAEARLVAAVERGKPERNCANVLRLWFWVAGCAPTSKNDFIVRLIAP